MVDEMHYDQDFKENVVGDAKVNLINVLQHHI